MLSLSNFATHPKCNSTCLSQNPIPKMLFHPKNVNFLKFSAVSGKIPSGFCSYASKDNGKGVQNVLEIEEDDKDFDFFDEDREIDDGDVDYEDGDDDEVIIPLKNMKKWLENKPRGFGEGKVYDTSIEDKLMEEIEQSRKAQLANVNKLKNNPVKTIPKKEKVDKSKDVQEGYRVRLVNLPKKKNVHRDLRLAFEGVPGMIDTVPAVYGNKKTRDPVCKGFAFVDFKSEDEAFRFVQKFNGQSIAFGKVQKQIKCNLLNSDLTRSAHNQSVDETNAAPQLEPLIEDGNPGTSYDADSPSIDSWEESAYDANSPPIDSWEESAYEYEDANEEHSSAVPEDDDEKFQIFGLAESKLGDAQGGGEETVISADEDHLSAEMDTDDVQEAREDSAESLSSIKLQKKMHENTKKAASERKKEKSPKLNIPGSASRLKIREKAMLTDVFSKYTIDTASATKEQS